ncbi:unnamed protein product [Arctogadus glacialis]
MAAESAPPLSNCDPMSHQKPPSMKPWHRDHRGSDPPPPCEDNVTDRALLGFRKHLCLHPGRLSAVKLPSESYAEGGREPGLPIARYGNGGEESCNLQQIHRRGGLERISQTNYTKMCASECPRERVSSESPALSLPRPIPSLAGSILELLNLALSRTSSVSVVFPSLTVRNQVMMIHHRVSFIEFSTKTAWSSVSAFLSNMHITFPTTDSESHGGQ